MLGLEPGELFADRYEIIRRLGVGGMGAVYLACDPRDRNFLVALKVLFTAAASSNRASERFRNEIAASYRINHPNVVRAYEYFDADEFHAFAMEYVDGGDLLQRMRGEPLGSEEAGEILCQLAAGLDAIHGAGIVHRDLKPENLLLTKQGTIKISDFGVARMRGANTLTQAGAMVGTPKYLAPEYMETGECDHRGDIFAAGVIGYELVSGVYPFGPEAKLTNTMERFKYPVAPLGEIAPHCPAPLAGIIEKAMSVRLSRRYQSSAELLADLERFKRGEPLLQSGAERPVRAASQAIPRARALSAPQSSGDRKLAGLAAAAAASVLLAVIGVAAVTFRSPNELPRTETSAVPSGQSVRAATALAAAELPGELSVPRARVRARARALVEELDRTD